MLLVFLHLASDCFKGVGNEYALSPIRVLPWLHYPQRLLLLLGPFLKLFKGLGVNLLNVEGERHVLKGIFFPVLFVFNHIVEQGFFISQHEISLIMIMHHDGHFHGTEQFFFVSFS